MGDFELESVLEFMVSKDGRVRNHELVTHFKNFLNHPKNKAQNREKFKDFVNELATIKLDESGEKVLILKKKYRQTSDGSSTSNLSITSNASLATASISSLSVAATPKPVKSSNGPPPTASNLEMQGSQLPSKTESQSNLAKGDKVGFLGSQFQDQQETKARAQSEPPTAPSNQSEKESDTLDGAMMSRAKLDEAMEVKMRHTDRIPPSAASSMASLTSTDSQLSTTSATSGKTSTDEDNNVSVISVRDKVKNLNQISSQSDLGRPVRMDNHQGHHKKWTKPNHVNNGEEDDDVSHSSSTSYVTLNAEQKEWMVVCSSAEYHEMNRLLSKNPQLAKLRDFTNGYTALHWGAKAGKDEVIKLIANKPGVNIDQRSNGGYTALHLAAIHGHEHIIELLVQTYKADANLRDYSGKKAKQYLKNSASSKAQQLLVSRRLGSDIHPVKSLDDSFIRSTSMRMSNRAKAISSLMQSSSVLSRQSLLRASWAGSHDDMREEDERGRPSRSVETSPAAGRKDSNMMPPPSSHKFSRHARQSERTNSNSRERRNSPRLHLRKVESQHMGRSESAPDFVSASDSVDV